MTLNSVGESLAIEDTTLHTVVYKFQSERGCIYACHCTTSTL